MKKSKSMRTAAVLLVCTLITSCIYSGTLAKYVTSDSAADSARVAKWGVEVSAVGNLFGKNYEKVLVDGEGNETADSNQISVSAKGSVDTVYGGDIVAPGTKNDTGLTVRIKGTPEVDTGLVIKSDVFNNPKDIFLKGPDGHHIAYAVLKEVPAEYVNGKNVTSYYEKIGSGYQKATTYKSATTYYKEENRVVLVDGTGTYYPVKWKVNIRRGLETEIRYFHSVYDAIQISFFLDTIKTYKANNPIDKEWTFTWEWKYQVNDMYDGADTILGLLAAHEKMGNPSDWFVVKESYNNPGIYETMKKGVDYNLDVMFDITVTATQID